MIDLILIRHAKSSWKSRGMEDFDRPLNEKGFADIEEMAELVHANLPVADMVLSSSAKRARQTIQGLQKNLSWSAEQIIELDNLYLAGVDEILMLIRTHASGNIVYLCGHNPGISEFASRMCRCEIADLPTLGIVHMRLVNIWNSWEHINWGDGEIKQIYIPGNAGGNI